MKENTNLIVLSALVLLVLACFALVYKTNTKDLVITEGSEGIPKISATGDAKQEISPDEAEIRIKMQTKAKTPDTAQDQNSKVMSNVQTALKKAGIESDKIETVRYNIYPITEWNPKTRRSEDKGYRAEHVIKITTNDLDKVGTYIEVAVNAGANSIEGINFTLSKSLEKEVKQDVLKQAALNGREKASAIADGLGVKIGDLLSVSETSYGWGPIHRSFAMAEKSMAGADAAPPPIEPELVTVTAQINVSYKIE